MREARAIMADLSASGLTPEQIALVMELSASLAVEARPVEDKPAQRRRAKDRAYQAERRRQNRPISADAPPKEINQTPCSDPEGSGAEPPQPDPMKAMFDLGVSVLTAAGHTERQARSLTAKWQKSEGNAETIRALMAAKGKTDPVSYITAWFAKRRQQSDDLGESVDAVYGAKTG